MDELGQPLYDSPRLYVGIACIVRLAYTKQIANIQNKIFNDGCLYHRFHAPEKRLLCQYGT
jgi:hypothetical protein